MMNTRRPIDGIVCFSPDPWGDVKRPQQLMQQLSAKVPVVYVEAPMSLPSMLKRLGDAFTGGASARWTRAITGRAEELARNIHVVTPLVVVPEHRLSSVVPLGAVRDWLRRAGRGAAGRRAARAARAVGMDAPALWIGHPLSVRESDVAGMRPIVYDCVDRWSDFPGALADETWGDQIAADERELLDSADVVLCSARGLYERSRASARGTTLLVPNAADVEHFRRASAAVPSELADLHRPIIGYVGALAEWVDLDLVRDVALLHPEWSIVLVGPVYEGAISGDSAAMQKVAGLGNVHVLGARPYEDIPRYVAGFDAAIVPFKVNGLTEDTSPIKVYEYLSSGVPVVSTPLPEVAGLTGVTVASGAPAFAAAIQEALSTSADEALISSRIDEAERNSWHARADFAWEGITSAAVRSSREVSAETTAPAARPTVLVISTDVPWPMDSGWRIRAFENIRALTEFSDVTLISFSETKDSAVIDALREALPDAEVLEPVPHRIHIKHQRMRVATTTLAGVLRGRPYKVQKFSSAEMRRRLRAIDGRFDVVHAELATQMYAGIVKSPPGVSRPSVVVDEHNVESQLLADHCSSGEFGMLTPAVRAECTRTLRYETSVCGSADLVVTISDEDRSRILEMTGDAARVVTVAPVAAGAEGPRPQRSVREDTVLFVGQMSWLPNQEAIRWLCDGVLPAVRARRPDVRMLVVGGGAPPELRDYMAASGVEALGYVEDISTVYDQAAVYAAPFLTGGGVRIKLLDAMREGIPIVTTTTGAKGLDVVAGDHLLIGDTADEFAECVSRVLGDPVLAQALASAAREYLVQNHSRAAAVLRFRSAYAGLPTLANRGDLRPGVTDAFASRQSLGAVRQR